MEAANEFAPHSELDAFLFRPDSQSFKRILKH
jgi:hypothetical protein